MIMTSPATSVLLSSSLSELFGKDCDPSEPSFINGLVSTLWELLPPKDLDSPFKLNPRDRLSEFSIVRERAEMEKIEFGKSWIYFGRKVPSLFSASLTPSNTLRPTVSPYSFIYDV